MHATNCPTFPTLHAEDVGRYAVARMGQVNAMVAAGLEAVR
jgi:hypothetical protein